MIGASLYQQRGRAACGGGISTLILLVLVVLSLVAVVLAGIQSGRRSEQCLSNLQAIYNVFELYEVENGMLPTLAFYPDDPMGDDDSLRLFVEKQGLDGDCCICPSSPGVIRGAGLSYIWNVELNGNKLSCMDMPIWMLVEVHVLSDQVPAPHRRHYHLLYTDGTIERISKLPEELIPLLRPPMPGA